MPRRFLLLVLVLMLSLPSAWAQGFNAFNGRNHPELDWQVAETEHFRIMYPAHLAGIEAKAAAIAEASYAALTANLGVTFEDKIRIYLSDEDEITNGFAVPVGTGYTHIWVHPNDVAIGWTGQEKWLRKVVAHELAHIVHYRAVRSNIGLYQNLVASPLPRFWTEGLAQYETETWDAYRGDRWLRTAVLDDRLSYDDGRSAWNGRLLYAVGNAQVRYFAQQYGDSTLKALLAHRTPKLFGLAEVHDFETAFEATTGETYRAFYDDWRRAVNVYYNTLASGLETTDSLGTEPLQLPGQYLYEVRYSPDTSRVVVIGLTSLARPVRRLYLVDRSTERVRVLDEGSVHGPVTWSADGRRIVYTARVRGRYGSLLNDLFMVDLATGERERLTESRRASSPSFSPDGRRLAFVASAGGTANVVVRDLQTGTEQTVTRFEGDVQLGTLRWHPAAERLAVARFAADGRRDIVLVDLAAGTTEPLTDGAHDDRHPLWSPDGRMLAFTSFRDDVPNVFVRDLATGLTRRVTYQVTGAEAHDWLRPDSVYADGRLVVIAGADKTRDRAFAIDAGRTPNAAPPDVPSAYTAWTSHRPPATVPSRLEPAPALIAGRYAYRPWRNLTHASSLVLPYYGDADDWGLFGWTSWFEPLGKHLLAAGGSLSLGDLAESTVFGSYVNNSWWPTVALSAYHFPSSARIYGDDLLVESATGGDVSVFWPLDWRWRPYTSTQLGVRVRYAAIEPLNPDDFTRPVDDLPTPETGEVADLRLTLQRTSERPYRYGVVHPLDGTGVRLRLTGGLDVLGTEARYLRADLGAYRVLRLPLMPTGHRLYVYGRAQAQTGEALAQDLLGLQRYDQPELSVEGLLPVALGGDEDRVRGYRSYVLGNRVLFGTVEYRWLVAPSLRTQLLGLVSLGATALAAFADAGLVWRGADFGARTERLGVGVELKNALGLFGVVQLAHAVGVAQPAAAFGSEDDLEVYYRIRMALPF